MFPFLNSAIATRGWRKQVDWTSSPPSVVGTLPIPVPEECSSKQVGKNEMKNWVRKRLALINEGYFVDAAHFYLEEVSGVIHVVKG